MKLPSLTNVCYYKEAMTRCKRNKYFRLQRTILENTITTYPNIFLPCPSDPHVQRAYLFKLLVLIAQLWDYWLFTEWRDVPG